ncbi:hypothetical protein ABLG96_02270 [Nakamurella sp. A5-74]|uniref:Uncharacterized protein n=1 Tax=Nakamurella sp. A5-74 TaxID=3158264 RepID=A0AAU8DPS5_9ACTN
MPARAFVPPVPPTTPRRPEQRSGFRMQLPRAVQQAVADADSARRRRRAASRPDLRPHTAGTVPIIPVDLGRLFGRSAPDAAPD